MSPLLHAHGRNSLLFSNGLAMAGDGHNRRVSEKHPRSARRRLTARRVPMIVVWLTSMCAILVMVPYLYANFDPNFPSEKARREVFSTNPGKGEKKPTFVAVLGLEGTGHHFVGTLLKTSPTGKRLEELNVAPTLLKELLAFFWYNGYGLWNAHCDYMKNEYNLTETRDETVRMLQRINDKVANEGLTVAINSNGFARAISYPTGKTQCRPLNYPVLDHFYHVCKLARVKCSHIYIYRDPYGVINSASRRGFNPSILSAIHLYTSHLNILYAQLSAHPTKTAGCFGFFDPNSTKKELWDPIRDWFGWTNQTEFDEYIDRIYLPPPILTEEERKAMFPSEVEMHIKSMVRAHEQVLKLCREQTKKRLID